MAFLITREHLELAKAAGACTDGLANYRTGMSIRDIDNRDLCWVEENLPDLAAELARKLSVSAGLLRGVLPLSAFGSGDGYGHGDGSAYGSGFKNGSGYGNGEGSAYGYGDSNGSGYGYGYGAGYSYGSAYGSSNATRQSEEASLESSDG